jgi:hypothetical protein
MKSTLAICLLSLISHAAATDEGSGQVQIPLDVYNQLIESTRVPGQRPAPLGFALGNASLRVSVASIDGRPVAEVSVSLPLEVFENQWVLVPVLPPGTPVTRASVSGNPVQLVATALGLSYGTNVRGSYTMELAYSVDASATGRGYVLAVPVPQASSLQLSATLPGSGLDVTVIPASGVRVSPSGSQTSVQATVPSTSGIQIAWRAPSAKGPTLSRATYRGEVAASAVAWRAELRVELFEDETATLPLLPGSLTLTSLTVDGKEAPILVEGGRFATVVRGRGGHVVAASFQTPVAQENGPPSTVLLVPQVPVSRVELLLPGRKEVTASPSASVVTRARGSQTEATVHVPLTEKVSLSWSEAVPEAARRELRANASLYHVLHAEEGVLYGRAHVVYEVQHGGTSRIELGLPALVEVNQVSSETGAIADWRVEILERRRVLRIFLDRELTSELRFTVDYDRSLGTEATETLPLLSAVGVSRQRGMAALVPTRELALNPTDIEGATRVGENQLPPFVRDTIDRTIAHTLKYADAPPALRAAVAVPERVAGRFDADVDTLVSLGDVAVLSSASVELHVKSGGLDRVDLLLPAGANLLNLVAPSLRTHRVVDGVVEVEFTQEMEGDFRIEATYERLLGENVSEVDAGTLHVRGAEVEQGRIAIEAASVVEIAPLAVEALSPLDLRELPRQLVLRTSHPILHAFRYVRAEPAPRLSLRISRHETASVQEAVIDRAEHRTLFTRDGLAVTTSRFLVRNRRKQFLRLALPQGSEMWSVFVAGKAEKPAISDSAFLVRIVSSSDAFPVELVYSTKIPSIGVLGSVALRLPRPDLLVTESRWDWYLPEGLDYRRPSTNMSVALENGRISGEALAREIEDAKVPEAFRIHVPVAGIHYAFEMLYANHGDVEARVRVPYASRAGVALGQMASFLGVWIVFAALRFGLARRAKLAAGALGALLTLVPTMVYGISPLPAIVLAAALAVFSLRHEIRRAFERRRSVEENG